MKPAVRVAVLLILYLALALLPLALAAWQDRPRRPWPDELSSGLALVAFATLLLEFLLSGRYRAISAGIGMDVTMRFHQVMALVATALLLLHPFVYRLPYTWPQPGDSARLQHISMTPTALLTGLGAWMLLVVLVTLAQFREHLNFSYETWRVTHGVGALALAALGAHHVLDSGRYAQDPILGNLWLFALVCAVVVITRAYLLKPLLQRRHTYRVASIARAAERVWQLELEPAAADGWRFAAGQFVWLKLGRTIARVTEHPFSIASAPSQLPRVAFLIKEHGDFTGTIGRLPIGTPAFLDGPYGNLTLTGRDADALIMIAGGVGVAPLLSIVRELAAQHDPRPVTFIYADRNMAQLVAREELATLARTHNLTLHYLLQEPPPDWRGLRGVPDAQQLAQVIPDPASRRCLYLVCGPPGMIDRVELALAQFGVPLSQIVSERFRYLTGVVTPRERLTRALIALVVSVELLAVLAFALM